MQTSIETLLAENKRLNERIGQLESALRVAIMTVECDSLDRDGNELPWYVGAKIALGERNG